LMMMCLASVAAAQSASEGSGTAWLPQASPMYMVHAQRGAWTLMTHENVFVQFVSESGRRGGDQVGSVNWLMTMADRHIGRGRLAMRAMFSAEPWTIGGCGYPDLLASGEECRGEAIHDRQHPHDLPMELSAEYDAPIARDVRWQVYGGPSAEPALGPVAYPHRVSAMPNPIAPITHHWIDSTHVSFGVVTGGVYSTRWKAETSLFNGREPDDNRKDFDFGRLDSVSGRVWFMPTPNVAMQFSAGHLAEAEAAEGAAPRRDVDRFTASVTVHGVSTRHVAASTIAWGRNQELGHGTNALLLETNLTLKDRDTLFGRLELVQKTPHDLGVVTAKDRFTVAKLQGGYTRYVRATSSFKAGIGAAVSAGIVPAELAAAYGGRMNPGVAVFVTVRPGLMTMDTHPGTMIMVQTAYDPAKLTCAAGFDPRDATSTTYEGRTYYFCSTQDRDKFLTDPQMSLKMMPPKQ